MSGHRFKEEGEG